ncbi:MAG: DUF4397 domain-containing protein [Chlorobi bacterium]|nr:DUF4397 domain-containing protein [Chlorobiota bacterium]
MKSILSTVVRAAFPLLGAALLSVAVTSCGDDPAAPQPTGNSTITVFHANPGFNQNVVVKRESQTLVTELPYGQPGAKVIIPNGNNTMKVFGTDGTELASAQLQADSAKSAWAIFAGTSNKREMFSVITTKKPISSGTAAVRVIQASESAPSIKVLVNEKNGLALAPGAIPYKSGSDFINVPVATTQQLIITNSSSNDSLLAIPVTLVAGKQYTAVVYGSTSGVGQYALSGAIVEDVQ